MYVPYPGLRHAIDHDRLEAIRPGVEVLDVPYEIEHEFRAARERDPFSDELRLEAPPLSPEQAAAFGRAHVILTLDVPMDLPPLAPNLRWIQAIGSGVGQFVSARLPDGEIVLTNGASIGAASIAEWTLARILQILKRLPEHDARAREHRWVMAHGTTLAGRTVAIVGLGAIGREVARRARAFGVHLIGLRRHWSPGETDVDVDELTGPDEFHAVLGRSDVVVAAVPGTAENESLFDAAAFAAMCPGAIFLNVGRGALVDEDALMASLHAGRLRAAAIDVARTEPLPPDSPLWTTPNLYISPHSSAGSDDYARRAFDLFCDNLSRFVAGEPLRNVVDLSTGY
ncbi:MAG TPA: D-2-hydroxyacid dehydrogenase [Acidimicrobiales bacterium]